MKLKNLFFGSLACLAFAACSNDDDVVVNPSAEGKAFIAVNISMPQSPSTRAWDNTNNDTNYEEGEDYEVNVNDVKLYFFNTAGTSWCEAVDVEPENWNDVDGNAANDKVTDVEDSTFHMRSNIVIALDNVTESNYPTKVVAVVNGPALTSSEYATLEVLSKNIEKELNTIKVDPTKTFAETNGNFVMSNSVYYSGEIQVNYTTVTLDNFGTDKDLGVAKKKALAKPVKIVVERVLARVSVDLVESEKNVMSAAQTLLLADGTDLVVYSIANGWWLDQTNTQSNLIKRYESKPTISGWDNWNHDTYFRSYWANAVNYTSTETSKFTHYRYENAKYKTNDKYCYENTNANKDYCTNLCVSANLYTLEGSVYTAVEDLIQWQYYFYKDISSFKNAVLTYLKTAEEGAINVAKNGADLTAADIKLVWNTNTETYTEFNYQAIVQLNGTEGSYQINGEDKSAIEVNAHLKDKIGEFKYWNGGQTYYYTPIVHNSDVPLNGVIRNHLYKINVKSLKGLGTPVPSNPESDGDDPVDPTPDDPADPIDPNDPDNPIDPEVPTDPTDPTSDPDDPQPDPDKPIDPETPEDDVVSAIATEIVILEYRVVNQEVDLGK